MKLFDKKCTTKILDEDIKDAQLSSMDFSEEQTKKRAFIDVLGARLAMKMLFSKKIEANNLYSLYSIHKILSEFDIADIYFEGLRIDVRLVFNKDEIFIPKTHFKYDILPNIYMVLVLEENLSSVEFLGYFEPQDIEKKNANKEFYFVEKDKLKTPDTFKKFLESYVLKDDFEVNEKDSAVAEEMFLEFIDNQISTKNKQFLVKQLSRNIELREKFVEFENFEILSKEAVKQEDMLKDNLFDIIGAQKVFEDEAEQTQSEHKAEVIGEVLEGILDHEEAEAEAETESSQTAEELPVENLFEEIEEEKETAKTSEPEVIINQEKADKKSEGKILENSVKALTAGLELGAVVAATTGAAMAASGAAAASSAQVQGEIIKGGAEVLSQAVNAGLNAAKTDIPTVNLEEKPEIKMPQEAQIKETSSFGDEDDITLDELSELFADEKEEKAIESVIPTETEDITDAVLDAEKTADETILEIDNLLSEAEKIETKAEPAFEAKPEQEPEPEAKAEAKTNIEPELLISEDSLPDIDFGMETAPAAKSEEPEKEETVEEKAVEEKEEVEESTVDTDEETEEEQPKSKKEPEFLFESDFDTDNSNEGMKADEEMPVAYSNEKTETEEETAPVLDELSEFEKLKAQMKAEESSDDDTDLLEGLPLDKLGIDLDAIKKKGTEKEEAEEEDFIEPDFAAPDITKPELTEPKEQVAKSSNDEELFSFDDILPEIKQPSADETPAEKAEKEDDLDAKIRALEELEDNEGSSKKVEPSSASSDNFLDEVDNLLKDINLTDEQKSLIGSSIDFDDDLLLETKPVAAEIKENNIKIEKPEIKEEISKDFDLSDTYSQITQTETANKEGKDPLKVLFEKENIEELEEEELKTEKGFGLSKDLISPDFYKSKKMVLAASIAGVVLLSAVIGASSIKNNQSIADIQQNTTNAPISADLQQPVAPTTDDMALPVTEQQTLTPPDATQPTQQALPAASGQLNTDMGKSVSDAFLSEPVNATISKIAWEVPEDVAYNDSFRKYLQIAGKNLKLNLQNDLLLTNEMAYSSKVIVDLIITRNGTLQTSNITVSSGSKQIDKIVLQSVKETLKYLKFPSDEVSGATVNATLIINF